MQVNFKYKSDFNWHFVFIYVKKNIQYKLFCSFLYDKNGDYKP